jgi:hypothetical protein
MQEQHRELWQRLAGFRFDNPNAALTFTARLARENGWPIGYADRVVDEYRRFVFLAMTAGHEVTPSDQVDQVWHLHLTYTHKKKINGWRTKCCLVISTLPRTKPFIHSAVWSASSRSATSFSWNSTLIDAIPTRGIVVWTSGCAREFRLRPYKVVPLGTPSAPRWEATF